MKAALGRHRLSRSDSRLWWFRVWSLNRDTDYHRHLYQRVLGPRRCL